MTEQTFGTDDNQNPGAQAPAAAPAPAATAAFKLEAGDRTFTDPTDAANHINHAQGHIKNLEEENRLLREKNDSQAAAAATSASVEEQVKAMLAKAQENQQGDDSSQTGTIDINELVKQVTSTVKGELSADEVKAQETVNWDTSKAAAIKLWGEDYLGKITEKAATLGLSVQEVDRMAKKTPAVFQKTILDLGVTKSGTTHTTDSTVNTASFQGNADEDGKPRTSFHKKSSKDRAAEVKARIAAKEAQ